MADCPGFLLDRVLYNAANVALETTSADDQKMFSTCNMLIISCGGLDLSLTGFLIVHQRALSGWVIDTFGEGGLD